MASNTVQFFRNADKVTNNRVALTTTAVTDAFAVDAAYVRDLTRMIVMNSTGSSVDLTITENDGTNSDIIHKVTVPANAGIAVGNNAVKLIQDVNYQIPGCRYDPFGNFFFRVANGRKLRLTAQTANALVVICEFESLEP